MVGGPGRVALLEGADPRGVPQRGLSRPARADRDQGRGRGDARVLRQGGRPALRLRCFGRARGAHPHHPRPHATAVRRRRDRAGSRSPRDEHAAPAPEGSGAASAGGHARRRAGHRRDPRAGRRPGLSDQSVQPRHAGPPPAGLGVQAVRVSRGAARRRGLAELHGGDARRRPAAHAPDLPLANGGMRLSSVTGVRAVHYRDDEVKSGVEPPTPVVSAAEAWLVTSLLKGVVTSGTGSAARASGLPDVIAGKTGTTNDARDAWFVGYTPRLLALGWVGFDGGDVHGLSGAQAALPIWIDFMKAALDAYPQPDFTVPAGIAVAEIDATNGKRAGSSCPVIVREAFLAGTEPPECDEHRGFVDSVVSGWSRLTDWFRRRSTPEPSMPPERFGNR